MRKRVGLIGSILLGAAMVTVGLSGDLAWAVPDNGNSPGASSTNGCGPSGASHKSADLFPCQEPYFSLVPAWLDLSSGTGERSPRRANSFSFKISMNK